MRPLRRRIPKNHLIVSLLFRRFLSFRRNATFHTYGRTWRYDQLRDTREYMSSYNNNLDAGFTSARSSVTSNGNNIHSKVAKIFSEREWGFILSRGCGATTLPDTFG